MEIIRNKDRTYTVKDRHPTCRNFEAKAKKMVDDLIKYKKRKHEGRL